MGRFSETLQESLSGLRDGDLYGPSDDELEAMASEYHGECSPTPVPCDPTEDAPTLNAWELLTPEIIAGVIERNQHWLQWTNRTTSEVLRALFINVNYAGMTDVEAMRRVSPMMFVAGYTPNEQSPNPIWTFPA